MGGPQSALPPAAGHGASLTPPPAPAPAMNPLAAAILEGAAKVLAMAGLTTLTMYTQLGRWEPALVAGGVAACSSILTQLGVIGAMSTVGQLRSSAPPAGGAPAP